MKQKVLYTLLLTAIAQFSFSSNWYVNINTGDDNNDGTSAVFLSGNIGPKKSINGALMVSLPNDTITISEGVYEEVLILDRAIVLRGNNWGINPVTQSRNPETIIVPPSLITGMDILGNSVVEIRSCCIKLDGIMIYGDNSFINTPLAKYDKQYEMSYGIGGIGNFNNLHFTNLIVSNFLMAAISVSGGSFSTQSNKIDFCKFKVGEQNSIGIDLKSNFYSDINLVTIDSTLNGLVLSNYSDKNNTSFSISYLNVRAEKSGITLHDFVGNTDVILLEYNNLSPMAGSTNFTGIELLDLTSKGRVDVLNNTINDCYKGVSILNNSNNFNIFYNTNSINKGSIGVYIDQSSISTDISLSFQNSSFKGMDSAAIFSYSEGDLVSIELVDVTIEDVSNGLFLFGNSTVDPTNTQFDDVKRYYFFLDSSFSGIQPGNKIDATVSFYNGVLGNNLGKNQAFIVENKIRHILDRQLLGWVLFCNTKLFVSNFDGNLFINPAINVASNGWNIFTDNTTTSEKVLINKTINLYTNPETSIGKLVLDGANRTLFLHGKLALIEGLTLKDGKIETTEQDTLIIYRNNYNTSLSAGNIQSYIQGPFYMRYINIPENYSIVDTLPAGLVDDFRPIHLNATWPAGLFYFDMGVKSFSGKAPILNLPTTINRISDIRYWQLSNPFNSQTFTFNSVGFNFNELVVNDLVNDSANLRIVYNDNLNSFNLGGFGYANKNGFINSSAGTPGIGLYALGNAKGGKNTLSQIKPIANITLKGNCSNDSVTISAINSRSEIPIAFWNWKIQGPSSVSTPEIEESITKKITTPGNYVVTLIVTNTNGYEDTTTTDLVIDPVPQIAYSASSPCFPAVIELTNKSVLPNNTTIKETKWTVNTTTFISQNLTYTPSSAGIKTGFLKVTLTNGCSDSLPISFDSPVLPSIKLIPNGNSNVCIGDSLKVNVKKSAGIVQWNDSKNYDSLYLKTNTFKKAIIFTSLQCFASDSIKVTILAKPIVNAGADQQTLPGKPIYLKGNSPDMVEWIPDTWLNDATILNPTCRPLISTKYILRAYNTDGCEATDSMMVTVNSENDRSIPNLLTPNGDGHNDLWVLSSINDPKNCKVSVFTREGFLVYSSNSYNNDWDGKRESNDLPDGYYLFVIEHQKENKVYSGILNIIR